MKYALEFNFNKTLLRATHLKKKKKKKKYESYPGHPSTCKPTNVHVTFHSAFKGVFSDSNNIQGRSQTFQNEGATRGAEG